MGRRGTLWLTGPRFSYERSHGCHLRHISVLRCSWAEELGRAPLPGCPVSVAGQAIPRLGRTGGTTAWPLARRALRLPSRPPNASLCRGSDPAAAGRAGRVTERPRRLCGCAAASQAGLPPAQPAAGAVAVVAEAQSLGWGWSGFSRHPGQPSAWPNTPKRALWVCGAQRVGLLLPEAGRPQ